MVSRRTVLLNGLGLSLLAASPTLSAKPVRRLVFVHGRSQEGKDQALLKKTWIDAFQKGAEAAGMQIPDDLEIAFPFYGDVLADFTERFDLPLTTDIQTRGDASVNEDFLLFQAELVESLRIQRGITEEQVNEQYGDNPKEKGPLNWEWVQAILRTLDKHGGGVNQFAIEKFTRDVFLYTRRSVVRNAIDKIVADEITQEPTVVVGHSLGSVVAYSVLRTDPRALTVPLYLTVGSPLGIRAIRNNFKPLRFPMASAWFNAYDTRDVVALYPLDGDNFPVSPEISNYTGVKNHTDNRHGIVGYLDDPTIAKAILDTLG